MTETDKAARADIVVARVEQVASTVTEMVRAEASQVHRLVRTTRTATATIMVRADAADLIAADREARVASAVVRVEPAASTVAARADRVVSDLVLVWALVLQYLQLISLASQLRRHSKAKNRYITARMKSSTMITSLVRRRRLKHLQA